MSNVDCGLHRYFKIASLGNNNTLETCKTFGQHPWLHNINYEFPHRIYVINSTTWCQVEAIVQFWWIKCNPYWVILSTSSSGIDYVLNEHENTCQYSRNAISSKLMSYYIYSVSLVNKNAIPVELSCQWAHREIFVSLTSMKMHVLTNITHMLYHPR